MPMHHTLSLEIIHDLLIMCFITTSPPLTYWSSVSTCIYEWVATKYPQTFHWPFPLAQNFGTIGPLPLEPLKLHLLAMMFHPCSTLSNNSTHNHSCGITATTSTQLWLEVAILNEIFPSFYAYIPFDEYWIWGLSILISRWIHFGSMWVMGPQNELSLPFCNNLISQNSKIQFIWILMSYQN